MKTTVTLSFTSSWLLWLIFIIAANNNVSATSAGSGNSSLDDRIGNSVSTLAIGDSGNMSWTNSSTEPQLPQGKKEDGQCINGLLIPMWEPHTNLSTGDRVLRGIVYFVAMIYLFIGVSIIADRFMGAIEVITSKEKEVRVKKPNGDVQIVVVRVWNETVANLSLMALGSSAPEILLSIIEVYAKDYDAGDLGPGTIVGSAAFNLFMIIGLCVYVIPDGQVRKIKHLRVFFVTATWSIFAYVWLYLILAVFSEGVVEVWEGVVTFLFFFATVITAYIADRRLLFYKYISKEYRVNRRGVIVGTEGGTIEMAARTDVAGWHGKKDGLEGMMDGNHVNLVGLKTFEEEEMNDDVREFEEHRREYIQLLRELRKKHPDLGMRAIEVLAREQLASSGPKSRAFYRIQATRKLTGGANLVKKAMERIANDLVQVATMPVVPSNHQHGLGDNVVRIFFDPGHYTVMENVGEFAASVRREGGDLNQTVLVDYRTEDGSASAGSDYIAVQGTLIFQPRETLKTFNVCILDDYVFEEDEHFYIRLSNARLIGDSSDITVSNQNGTGPLGVITEEERTQKVSLISPFLATVMILDDDHCGIFNLAEKDVEIVESVGTYDFRVVRWSGARGRVAVPFRTIEGTAKKGKDYEDIQGEVIFENNEIEKIISLHILEEDSYEKDVLFYLEIDQPRQLGDGGLSVGQDNLGSTANSLSLEEKVAQLGKPKLGKITRSQIRIKESKEFKNMVDKLVKRTNASLVIGSSSWKEQFIDAITVNPSGDDGGNEDRGEKPSCTDFILHFLTLFWKILFAFVPPPSDRMGGWLCFTVSIIVIGVLTAIIGDVASAFGCSVGLKDSVTAIAFVAVGTSVPDMFASKVAAVQDKYADASVGNVTGSNAVNVFVGIGIAWSMAAIVKTYRGEVFLVPVGSLAFSVTLFCTTAAFAMLVMMLRRSKLIGGELGGPHGYKLATTFLFVALWLFYVIMSSFEAYGYIKGF